MKEKHGIIIQNIILILTPVVFMSIFPKISEKNPALFQGIRDNFIAAVFIGVPIMIFPIAAPILNFIRSQIKYKKQIKKADEWWEQTGRKQIVELNSSIGNIRNNVCSLLSVNSLYKQLESTDFCNSRDCYQMYLISVSYQFDSFEDVLSFFYKEKIKEMEREETEQRHQEILDALEEANAESVRLREELESQGRRADFDRSILEMQLWEIKHK